MQRAVGRRPDVAVVVRPGIVARADTDEQVEISVVDLFVIGEVEFQPHPFHPFGGTDHRGSGAERRRVLRFAHDRAEHHGFGLGGAEDRPHIVEVRVESVPFRGVKQGSQTAVHAHLLDHKALFLVEFAQVHGTQFLRQAYAVGNDAVEIENERRALGIRKTHDGIKAPHAVIVQVIVFGQALPTLAEIRRILDGDVRRENIRLGGNFHLDRIEGVIFIEQIARI